jgi:predicted N-formylglutamate amidohydrolase
LWRQNQNGKINTSGAMYINHFCSYWCASTRSGEKITEDELSPFEQKIYEDNKRTNEIIGNAVLLSSKSLATYVQTEQALAQKELTAEQIRQARWQMNHTPINMEQQVKMGWGGAPEPLISMLASIASYRVVYHNDRPPLTRSVIFDSQPRNIKKYLKIIEQNTQGYIKDIVPDDGQEDKIIHVFYAPY